MRMKKKAALAATMFSVTMNMLGCAYGPPSDEALMRLKQEQPAVQSELTAEADAQPDAEARPDAH